MIKAQVLKALPMKSGTEQDVCLLRPLTLLVALILEELANAIRGEKRKSTETLRREWYHHH